MNKDKWLPIFSGIIVSIIFGLSFMVTRGALDLLAPLQLLGFRFALAALTLTVLHLLGFIQIHLNHKKRRTLFLLTAFQPVLYFQFETAGVQLTSASEAGMMMGLIPVFTALLEIPFFKNRPSWKRIACIFLSVSGIFFITIMKSNFEFGFNLLGIILLFGAIFSAAMYNIYSKKLSVSFKPVEITYFMMWAGAIIFNGMAIIQGIITRSAGDYFKPLTNPRVLIAIFYLGILSSVIAFFLMNYMLAKTKPSQTSTYLNLTTVVAILGGILFLGESFSWYQAIGSGMIIAGVWGSTWFSRQDETDLKLHHN